MERDGNDYGVHFTRAGLSGLLNEDEKKDVMLVISSDDLVWAWLVAGAEDQ